MNLNSLVKYVHMAETTEGRNTNPYALHSRCKTIGMSNEYGYAPFESFTLPNGSTFQGQCFSNHDQATATVTEWFEDHLKDMGVREALCVYNTGRRTSDCPYGRNYNASTGR